MLVGGSESGVAASVPLLASVSSRSLDAVVLGPGINPPESLRRDRRSAPVQ